MEAQELRIGNLVLEGKDICTVVEIRRGCCMVSYLLDGKFKCAVVEHDRLKPIPLTEEWLLKLRFEEVYKSPMHSTYYNDTLSYYFWYKKNKQYADYKGEQIDVKYVHTLQNLIFALTGTELKTETI